MTRQMLVVSLLLSTVYCKGACNADEDGLTFSDDETLPSYSETILPEAPAPTPITPALSHQEMPFSCDDGKQKKQHRPVSGQSVSVAAIFAKKVYDFLTTHPVQIPQSFDQISLAAKLQLAADTKNAEVLEQLMRQPEAGALFFSPNNNGLSLFSSLCLQEGSEDCIRVAAKAQRCILDFPLLEGFTTTLGLVIRMGKSKTVQQLLDLGADPDKARATELVGDLCAREGKDNSMVLELTEILKNYRAKQEEQAIQRVASEKVLSLRPASSRSLQG